MKKISVLILLILFVLTGFSQDKTINVIVFGAHPDDCEADAGGIAYLFTSMGHRVKFVSITNGDKGHPEKGGGDLAKIRREETLEAARILGVQEYDVMNNHDAELMPTLENRWEVIRKIREWNADIVIACRPNDYHPDHRYTAILVQDAAYLVTVPNILPDVPPLKKNPLFLYAQDNFQRPNPFQFDITIDISDTYMTKIASMAAHESQHFYWLPWLSGTLDKVPKEKDDRLKWLANKRKLNITPEIMKKMELWYGKERAEKATHVESFEICEYGMRPSEEQIRELFPMISEN